MSGQTKIILIILHVNFNESIHSHLCHALAMFGKVPWWFMLLLSVKYYIKGEVISPYISCHKEQYV